jgi:sugar lactone lactonase YvrE
MKVTPAGVTTLFAQGSPLFNTAGLAFDAAGNLFVACQTANTINKITPAGVVSTFVDNTKGLSHPQGIAFDGQGNLYVANLNNQTIKKVTPAGVVSTFVSTGTDRPGWVAFTPPDAIPPQLTSVRISSSNVVSHYAKAGDSILLDFTANERIRVPEVTIAGQAAWWQTWSATRGGRHCSCCHRLRKFL